MNKQKITRQTGMTLIETMVAMTISTFLIAGSIGIYIQTRSSYKTADSVARMQETANFALDTLEEDIRLAGFWGPTANRLGVTPDPGIGFNCGPDNYVVPGGTLVAIEAWDEETGNFPCADRTAPRGDSDVLVLRHVGLTIGEAADAGRIQFASDDTGGKLFQNGQSAPYLAANIRNVVVNTYYVSDFTAFDADLPSLRRLSLDVNGNLRDEEVIPGVENFQVQFGINDLGGNTVDRYVDPEHPAITPATRILSARIWLLIRSEVDETTQGFEDDDVYFTPDANMPTLIPGGDFYPPAYRRLAVLKTIPLKNNLKTDSDPET